MLTSASSGPDVVVSRDSVNMVHERFCNIVYGFFLGKRVSYPVVENYVMNTWSKFGLVKYMMNSNEVFFLKI